METTNESLLRRVRDRHDSGSWREFFKLYHPLLMRYGRKRGLSRADAEDVAQDCMRVLLKEMPRFDYSHSRGKFKSFLWKLANNAISQMFRKRRPRAARTAEMKMAVDQPETANADWDRLWQVEHLKYCLGRVASHFSDETIEAFQLYALKERPVSEVCQDLGLSPNQVYLAKSRVTARLRQEMRALIGDVQ